MKINCDRCDETKIEIPSSMTVASYSYICSDCTDFGHNNINEYEIVTDRTKIGDIEINIIVTNNNRKPTILESFERYNNPYIFGIGYIVSPEYNLRSPLILYPNKVQDEIKRAGKEQKFNKEYNLKIKLEPKESLRFNYQWKKRRDYYPSVRLERASETYSQICNDLGLKDKITPVKNDISELKVGVKTKETNIDEVKSVPTIREKKAEIVSESLANTF